MHIVDEEGFVSPLPSNFLVTSIFPETTNPSRYVRAPSGKTKVSLLQRALVLRSPFLWSLRSLFRSLRLPLRSWPSCCLSLWLATQPSVRSSSVPQISTFPSVRSSTLLVETPLSLSLSLSLSFEEIPVSRLDLAALQRVNGASALDGKLETRLVTDRFDRVSALFAALLLSLSLSLSKKEVRSSRGRTLQQVTRRRDPRNVIFLHPQGTEPVFPSQFSQTPRKSSAHPPRKTASSRGSPQVFSRFPARAIKDISPVPPRFSGPRATAGGTC